MVWAATQRGHDHDTADYEIYIWEVGTSPEGAARLTFNSANDRWPDIFIPSAVAAAAPAAAPAPAAKTAEAEKPAAKAAPTRKRPAAHRSKRR
jgi:hypothetical protein